MQTWSFISKRLLTAALLSSAFLLTALASSGRGTGPQAVVEWTSVEPEQVGLDSAELASMFDFIKQQEIPVHSILIVRHGVLAFEVYFYPFREGQRHDVASVTKSVTSTLIGLSVDQGRVKNVQQPIESFFPGSQTEASDERKRKITIENLLTMQAGWACGVPMDDPRMIVDEELGRMRRSSDWLHFALELPMVSEPGTHWAYCDPGCHVLSAVITKATGTNALAFARRALFEPLGIHDVAWPADPDGINYGWADLQLLPRDMAKIGLLFLQHGRWGDRRILSGDWIQNATRMHVDAAHTRGADGYGYYWWVPGDKFPGVFEAVGRGGQRITVWPAKDLVLVYNGGGFEPSVLAPFILRSIKADDALPRNREAVAQLRKEIGAATRPPLPHPLQKLPALAATVSGREFELSANTLDLSRLKVTFTNPAEATVDLLWQGHQEHSAIGLDGVDRFSPLSLTGLPIAGRGSWEDNQTFNLQLDLAGGINCYRFKFTFSDDGKQVKVILNERTGLNHEEFAGGVLK